MQREGKLWPQLQKLLGETRGLEDQAFDVQSGALNSVYPESMDMLRTGQLPEETAKWLSNLRDTRMANIKSSADSMVGNTLADMAKRGMTSSSTAEGGYGQVGKTLEPAISKAQEDYYNSMLTMPRQLSSDMFNMAGSYGSQMSNALKSKRSDLLGPYLDMWRTSTGVGAQNPAAQSQNSAGASMVGSIAGAAMTA
jgi:hypothetical protein